MSPSAKEARRVLPSGPRLGPLERPGKGELQGPCAPGGEGVLPDLLTQDGAPPAHRQTCTSGQGQPYSRWAGSLLSHASLSPFALYLAPCPSRRPPETSHSSFLPTASPCPPPPKLGKPGTAQRGCTCPGLRAEAPVRCLWCCQGFGKSSWRAEPFRAPAFSEQSPPLHLSHVLPPLYPLGDSSPRLHP